MAKKDNHGSLSMEKAMGIGCCKVESLISVDDRGQMVLPKDVRDKAHIRAGEKLAVISCEKDGEVCCISLIKAEELMKMVKGLLGPMMKDIFSE